MSTHKHTDSTDRVNKHVARSRQTRTALIDAGRDQFAERGYAAVSVEDVVRAAGVTRGALYHQFPGGKTDLFRAVVEDVEERLMERLGAVVLAAKPEDPIGGLTAGIDELLDACLEPEIRQITLQDAPGVLGWEEWRAMGSRYGLGLLRTALTAAMDAGTIPAGPVDPLAHVLLGALDEAGLYVSRAEDVERARRETAATLHRLLDALRGGTM